jgi:hypothetical protein
MPARALRLTVWRDAAHGIGVESSSRSWSPRLGASNATISSARTICGANRRTRL